MRAALRNLMFSMFFGSVFSAAIAPFVITALLQDRGASLAQLALIPFAGQCYSFFGFPVVSLFGGMPPKKVTMLTLLLGRTAFAVLAAFLLLPHCQGSGFVWLALMLYGLGVIVSGACIGPAYAWFKELLPSRLQGSFLGRRNALGSLTGAALLPLTGYALDKCMNNGGANLFPLFMFAGIAAGYLDLFFLFRTDDPRRQCAIQAQPHLGALQELKLAFRSSSVWRAAIVPALVQCAGFWLAPFSIILCFALGMDAFKTGLATALATFGMAGGMVYGGRRSDRSRAELRKLFSLLPLLSGSMMAVLGVLSAFILAGPLAGDIGVFLVMLCLLATSFFQGMGQSAQLKYSLEVVRGGQLAFSLMTTLQGTLSLCILGLSIWLGSWAGAHEASLKGALLPGFSYLQLIFACAFASGVFACLFFKGFNPYAEPEAQERPLDSSKQP